MIDANVLIAAFSPSEVQRHSDSLGFIENPELFGIDQWLVPIVVIVEAWGMLLKREGRAAGLRMLAWLDDPGNPVALCRYASGHMESDLGKTTEIVVRNHHVDVVDAILIAVADKVTAECVLIPHLQVATYDLRDFPRLRRDLRARVSIFDMNSMEPEN